MISVLVIMGVLLTVVIVLAVAERWLVQTGDCTLTINDSRQVTVQGGVDLLSCLNREGVFIPSACGGKGTCGFCKVRVTSGGGKLLPTEEAHISKKERAEGVRLGCQVKARGDLNIHVPAQFLDAREFEAEVSDIHAVTHDVEWVELRVGEEHRVSFKPGQYVQFRIPGTDEFRALSIASPPSDDNRLGFVVRLVRGGLWSTYVHKALEAGDRVTLTGPFGDFHLQEDSPRDIIAIGGGCGLAPIRSMALHQAERGMPRKFLFFFGARAKRDLFFVDELEGLAGRFDNFRFLLRYSTALG